MFVHGINRIILCSAAVLGAPCCLAAEPPRPNIVVILADDMGHGHVGCLNPQSKIATPHIDALAHEGMTFTDAHSGSAVCSPTRYGLLTGRYAWRTRLVSGVLQPYDPPLIEADRLTLPGMLKHSGYYTACIGKWHLGWDWPIRRGEKDPDFTQPIAGGPITRGFDEYFGTHVPNHPPYVLIRNDRTVGLPTDRKTVRDLDGRTGPMLPGWEFDQVLPTITKEAVDFIGRRAHEKQPFFLCFTLTSPHEPIRPSADFRGKSGLNALADFILQTDAVVGQIADAIEKHKLADNTLLIFTADNGSSLYTGGDELIRKGHDPSAQFRGYKASIYEGGHRVPFFARWPGKVGAGKRCEETICLTDLMATCAALIESPLPSDAGEDSVSILPLLLSQSYKSPLREATVHQSLSGQLAIRRGPWKLIESPAPNAPKRGNEPATAALYHLGDDVTENRNVYEKHPQIVAELTELLTRYRKTGRSR